MADTYELWADGQTGEVYAVRLEENRITGHCGPLTLVEMATVDLNHCPHIGSPETAMDTMQEWRGEEVVPRPQPGHRVLSRTLKGIAARRRQSR